MSLELAVTMLFAAVLLTLLALYSLLRLVLNSPAARMKQRLSRMAARGAGSSADGVTSELLRKTTPGEEYIFHLPLMDGVKKRVEHSGIPVTPFRFVIISVVAACAGLMAGILLSGRMPVALLGLLLCGVIPYACLGQCKRRRQSRFDHQLPDALTMVSRSLRAGNSLSGALEMLSLEMPEPTGGLFKRACEQQRLGMRITDSLEKLLGSIDSLDLHYFVTIIRITSETGGNLAEILDKLATTITSRALIRRQVRVYSAQGRLSGYLLAVLPVVVFAALYTLNPDYMKLFLTEQSCQYTLLAALLAQCAGFLMIKKIVTIRI